MGITNLGDFAAGATVYVPFHTFDSNDPSASVTITGLATSDIEIFKDGSATTRASDSGYALLDTDGIDFASITGCHGFSIDLSDNSDAGFFSAGSTYWVAISSVTVDGATINFWAAVFTIAKTGGVATILTDTEAVLTDSEAILADSEAILTDTEASQTAETSILSDTEAAIADTATIIVDTEALLVDTEAAITERATLLTDTEAILVDTGTTLDTNITAILTDTEASQTAETAILLDTEAAITAHATIVTDTEAILGDSETSQTTEAAILTDTEAAITERSTILTDTEAVLADSEAIITDTEAVLADTEQFDSAQAEPTGIPSATATPLTKLGWLYMMSRNKIDVTSSQKIVYGADGTAEFAKALADDGTTYTEAAVGTAT